MASRLRNEPLRFAIADPPYYGYGKHYKEHPDWADCDTLEWHQHLIEDLEADYDGWALHMTSGNLHDILPLCPKGARVMAWVKPFASFKPGVSVAYAWEPVVVQAGRRRTDPDTMRDWHSANITLQKGTVGAKPHSVVWWLLDAMGADPTDSVDDLFPGSGSVQEAIDAWRGTIRCQDTLFDEQTA